MFMGLSSFGENIDKKMICKHKLHLYFGNPFVRRVRRCVKCGRIVRLSLIGFLECAILNALFFFVLFFLTLWLFKLSHPFLTILYLIISSYFSSVFGEILFPLETDNRLLK